MDCVKSHSAAFVVLICLAGSACGQEERSTRVAAETDEQAKREWIAERVRQLNDPQWNRRKQATDELKTLGEACIPVLAELYPGVEDHETRLRIKEVVHWVFSESRLVSGGAFLGVRQRWAADKRVPNGDGGVLISEVLPETSAERAGLQAGDVVVEIDGRSMTRPRGNDEFSLLVSAKQVGAEIMLLVLRQGEQLRIPVRLGARPFRYADPVVRGRIQSAFSDLWSERFENPDGPGEDSPHDSRPKTELPG